jgi:hypothetical protein
LSHVAALGDEVSGIVCAECAAARTVAAHRNRRFALIDNIVLIAVLAIFISLSWWQQLRRDAWEWKVWLAITVWYVVIWVFSKSK